MSGGKPEAFIREETQGRCWCEVADEPVVVMKSRPVKAGNSAEGKTEETIAMVQWGQRKPKAPLIAKGGSIL